ncbi:capsule assembly Wzi family protein [Paremcibacter congregatus]|uniref:capsule assembly Wzi family protein n=1 Tax=Paremcibacter congregatus TaxID=2043170 RepID=UPI0030EF9415|tara:strand:+ start:100 stop:1578 length:1479 start_codon:yes stop_codon:yes gene_type:complete
MLVKKYGGVFAGAIFSLSMLSTAVQASPWAAVGDMQLRNDVEVLARHGVIAGPVNTWPISWKQITRGLSRTGEMDLPAYVRLAAMRVKEKIPGEFRAAAHLQLTNNPAIVRGFAKTARNDLDVSATFEYNNDNSGTTVHLEGGYRKGDGEDYAHLDGSYLSQDWGNWSVYAGAFDRWWGPGRESTLILSNNARPMPSVGLRRIEPKAFESKWLSWIGPWQWDMFVAKMEEDRHIPNALVAGMRLSFEPIENFEVGLSRTMQLCGDGRPCGFNIWTRALISVGDLDNTGTANEPGNQLASIDLAYSMAVGERTSLKLYAEGTAEDQNVVLPFQFAKLIGASLYGPYGDDGASWRLTTEYSDTTSRHAWLFGKQRYNVIYRHFIYGTGYRYKTRSIGHSLDNDSRLLSVVTQYQSPNGWEYTAKYHHVKINIDGKGGNSVSLPNETMDIFEASMQGDAGVGNFKVIFRHTNDGIPALGHQEAFRSVGVNWLLSY